MARTNAIALLQWISLASVLLGCASHYGIALDFGSYGGRIRGELRAPRISDEDIDLSRELVGEIARRYEFRERERIPLIPLRGSDTWRLLDFYASSYEANRDPWHHEFESMDLSLWVKEDRSALSVWIVDWKYFGVSDRLKLLRDEVKARLEERFPGYEIRVEEQELGFWSP